ncbi:MAG: hypothetical protein ACK5Y2_01980 [Bdellovibrionales bacterium]
MNGLSNSDRVDFENWTQVGESPVDKPLPHEVTRFWGPGLTRPARSGLPLFRGLAAAARTCQKNKLMKRKSAESTSKS